MLIPAEDITQKAAGGKKCACKAFFAELKGNIIIYNSKHFFLGDFLWHFGFTDLMMK